MRNTALHRLLLLLLGVTMMATQGQAQVNHPYPRTAFFHFGPAVEDYYARFDLVITPIRRSSFPENLKKINPSILVLPTNGWTAYADSNTRFPAPTKEHWLVPASNGEPAKTEWNGLLVDMTNYCPRYNGQRYNENFPEHVVNMTDLNAYDGIASDWLWAYPWNVSDVDFDRNGVNDFNEHGRDWVARVWTEGVETLLDNFRKLVPPNKLLFCNSGGWHTFGKTQTNGLMLEHVQGLYWDAHLDSYKYFMNNFRDPRIMLMAGRGRYGDPNMPRDAKEYYKLMRFLLAATMMGDGYFMFFDYGAEEYHYGHYYDEFDLDIGYPTSGPQRLSNGAYVRFFDRGAAIMNPSASDQTVTEGMLSGMSGYTGPYLRFVGGQDPQVNNGQKFDQMFLTSQIYNDRVIGDGIILVKDTTVVVSDIIVDNMEYSSSPGSRKATLDGNWSQTTDERQAFFTANRSWKDWYAHAFTTSGGSATFAPNITRPGRYEVFEWHGEVPGRGMASNVKYTVRAGGGEEKTFTVDQTQNKGKWNSLGVYRFDPGTSGHVRVDGSANGTVVADAIKLVFLDGRSIATRLDTDPPAKVRGVQIRTGE